MVNPSISDSSNITPQLAYLLSISGGAVTPELLDKIYPGFSTLSPSEQEQVIQAINAANPNLPYPVVLVLSVQDVQNYVEFSLEKSKNDIIDNMLDKWNDDIQEQIQRNKDFVNSQTYQSQQELKSSAYLGKVDQENRDTKVQFDTAPAQNTALSTPNERSQAVATNPFDEKNVEINPLVIGTAISATAGAISVTMIDWASTPMVGVNPVQDTWNQVVAPVAASSSSSNDAAVLSQIGALMAAQLMDLSNAQSVAETFKTGKPVDDKKTAQNFAENVLIANDNPKYTTYLQSVVISTMDPSKPVDMHTVDRNVAMIKTALLIRALAALNFIATSNHSGEEVLHMIKGDIPPPEGDMGKLIAAIKEQLSVLTPGEQASILSNMAAYIDTNPSVKDLTMSGSVFRNALPPNPLEEDLFGEQRD